MQAAWRGRIFLDAGALLYVGPGAPGDEHAHNAVQLVWSRDGAFDLRAAGRTLRRSAVLVPSAARHALDATGSAIATLLVESHDARGAGLDVAARREDYRDLTAALTAVPFPSQDVAAHDVAALCDRILAALGVTAERAPITATTRRAISYIERHLDGVPRVADVARLLSVSTTRVTHRFTSEVGIPFRRFVLWTRIKRAVEAHRSGRDLTAAAVEAGFSDAAHFSRTFRAMFGLSPSLVLPVAEIIGRAWHAPGERTRSMS
jgi:AraC-like DNA-binding protein